MCLSVGGEDCELVELCGNREGGVERAMSRRGQSSNQVQEKAPGC